ncbi:hypothetical protein Dimus_001620 [Dionaea muscipula]
MIHTSASAVDDSFSAVAVDDSFSALDDSFFSPRHFNFKHHFSLCSPSVPSALLSLPLYSPANSDHQRTTNGDRRHLCSLFGCSIWVLFMEKTLASRGEEVVQNFAFPNFLPSSNYLFMRTLHVELDQKCSYQHTKYHKRKSAVFFGELS